MKSDKSIRNICIASIKRSTMKPIDYPLTVIFEKETLSEIDANIFKFSKVTEEELPISRILIDSKNWTLITTRQVISSVRGIIRSTLADKIQSWHSDNFKGYGNQPIDIGKLHIGDDEPLDYYIETGKASMIIIYSIMTLIALFRKGE